jgi:flagellar motor switch protein FliG
MGVYNRFKKNPDGFRQLVELLESTPMSRRKKMIDVGMQEDAEYTQKALQYVLTFEDVLNLPDLELSEVLADAPPRFTAYAIHKASQAIKDRFITKSIPKVAVEVREYLETPNVTTIQIGGAQMKLIETTRKLERKGLISTKRIPPGL